MHTYLLQSFCILTAIHCAASSVLQRRNAPRIDEYNNVDCTTTFPDGVTNSTPMYHHSSTDKCVGIDPTTKSVFVKKGTGNYAALGYYTPGVCVDDWVVEDYDVTFNKSIDGGSPCHPVDRYGGRLHDIYIPGW